jgi:hypothetical protein
MIFIVRIHPAVETEQHDLFNELIECLCAFNAVPASVYRTLMLDNDESLERTGDLIAHHFAWPFVGGGDWDKGWSFRHAVKGKIKPGEAICVT